MGIFLEELMHISEHTHREPGVIILSGGVGVGKTKLLRAMKAKAADLGFRYIASKSQEYMIVLHDFCI